MDNITVGQVIDIVIKLVAFIGAIITLIKYTNKGTSKLLDEKLKPLNDNIEKVDKKVDKEALERLKSDLTTYLYIAHKDDLSSDQKMRFHEEYDAYIKMGGNSWVKDSVEKLRKKDRI